MFSKRVPTTSIVDVPAVPQTPETDQISHSNIMDSIQLSRNCNYVRVLVPPVILF